MQSLAGAHPAHPGPDTALYDPHGSTHMHMPGHQTCLGTRHPESCTRETTEMCTHMQPSICRAMARLRSQFHTHTFQNQERGGGGRAESLDAQALPWLPPREAEGFPRTRWFVWPILSGHPPQALPRMLRESRQSPFRSVVLHVPSPACYQLKVRPWTNHSLWIWELKGENVGKRSCRGDRAIPRQSEPSHPLEPSLHWICDSYHSFYIYRALPSVGDLMVKKSISVLVSDSARSPASLEIQDGVGSMRLDHRMEEEAPAPCLCSGSPLWPPAAARSKSSRHN